MEQQFRLKSLADDQLLAGLSRIVRKDNAVTAQMLAFLAELDDRQLVLELGFSSLWEYCVEKLGLCQSTAWRHIAAARVAREYPQAFAMVESGELQASALSLMKKHLNPENAVELLEVCRKKSVRQVELLLAARFPKPDVADAVHTLNVGSESGRLEVLAEDRYGVHFTGDGEFRDLLERVRGLAAHRSPNADLLTLMKRGLEAYERELEKDRFGVGRKPRARRVKPAGAIIKRRRQRPVAVAREVYERDGKQCTFVSADGRRCTSRYGLEIDHVEAWALGGENTVANQRLLCRAHNRQQARQTFGRAYVAEAIRRSCRS